MPAIRPNTTGVWASVEAWTLLLLLLSCLVVRCLAPDVGIGLLEADLNPDHLFHDRGQSPVGGVL